MSFFEPRHRRPNAGLRAVSRPGLVRRRTRSERRCRCGSCSRATISSRSRSSIPSPTRPGSRFGWRCAFTPISATSIPASSWRSCTACRWRRARNASDSGSSSRTGERRPTSVRADPGPTAHPRSALRPTAGPAAGSQLAGRLLDLPAPAPRPDHDRRGMARSSDRGTDRNDRRPTDTRGGRHVGRALGRHEADPRRRGRAHGAARIDPDRPELTCTAPP